MYDYTHFIIDITNYVYQLYEGDIFDNFMKNVKAALYLSLWYVIIKKMLAFFTPSVFHNINSKFDPIQINLKLKIKLFLGYQCNSPCRCMLSLRII